MKIDPYTSYVFEGRHLLKLEELKQRLYSVDQKRMTADEARNWANYLDQCLLPQTHELFALLPEFEKD